MNAANFRQIRQKATASQTAPTDAVGSQSRNAGRAGGESITTSPNPLTRAPGERA
jgi:hypothetical protein